MSKYPINDTMETVIGRMALGRVVAEDVARGLDRQGILVPIIRHDQNGYVTFTILAEFEDACLLERQAGSSGSGGNPDGSYNLNARIGDLLKAFHYDALKLLKERLEQLVSDVASAVAGCREAFWGAMAGPADASPVAAKTADYLDAVKESARDFVSQAMQQYESVNGTAPTADQVEDSRAFFTRIMGG